MVFHNYDRSYKYCLQEVREMRSRYESRLVEVDSGRQKEFESKLAEAMQQLRQEHESQIQQYKEDLERTFNAKVHNQDTLPHWLLLVMCIWKYDLSDKILKAHSHRLIRLTSVNVNKNDTFGTSEKVPLIKLVRNTVMENGKQAFCHAHEENAEHREHVNGNK